MAVVSAYRATDGPDAAADADRILAAQPGTLDQYDLLSAELPGQGVRKWKVLCGGRSPGGVITGYFATADFDGNPATTTDAGHNQCAGCFALDTTVSTSLADLSGSMPDNTNLPDVGQGYGVVQSGLDSAVLPRSLSTPMLLNVREGQEGCWPPHRCLSGRSPRR
ncbi:hypothetical protein [Streptomyces ferrugineus]|uniref:hypothetical protein n=1 Tax=Streptomyces ferrugineus TaxID=1413221 RepID=UPI001D137187|nr:hypothetical protein [Streptomyces ferrugineus]